MRYMCILAAAMVVVGCQARTPEGTAIIRDAQRSARAPATAPTTRAVAVRPPATMPATRAVAVRPTPIVYPPGTPATPEVRKSWPVSVAPYPLGAVVAGPTYYTDAPRIGKREWTAAALQPFWFLGQTIILPVSMVMQPPWTPVTYRGEGLSAAPATGK